MTPSRWLLPTLLFLTACAEGSAPSESGAIMADSAGVQIVRNGSAGVHGELTAREVLRLGSLDDEGPELFSDAQAVALDREGRIFAADGGSVSVRVFGRDGTFITEFGGRGEGPSELSHLNDLWVTGDTVVAVNWQRGGKVVLFDRSGEFLASWSVTRPDRSRIMPMHRTGEGWLMAVDPAFVPPSLAPGEPLKRTRDLHLMEFGSDSVGRQVYSLTLPTLYGTAAGEGGVDWSLFRPTSATGFDSTGRLYRTHPQAYRIDIHDLEGQLVRSIRVDYEPRAIIQDDVDELRTAALHVVDTLSRIPEGSRARQRRGIVERLDRQARLPLPEIATPIRQLLVSPDGSFWALRADTGNMIQEQVESRFGGLADFPPRPTRWDLFDRDGTYLGHVRLPARFRPEAVLGRDIVGVWADDLDVEHILRFRVDEPAAPS